MGFGLGLGLGFGLGLGLGVGLRLGVGVRGLVLVRPFMTPVRLQNALVTSGPNWIE